MRDIDGLRTVDSRLKGYFRFVKYFGSIDLAFFWLLAAVLPDEYLTLFSDRSALLWTLGILFIFSMYAFTSFSRRWPGNSVLQVLLPYAWLLALLHVVYLSGGANSPFTVLLIFPMLDIASDLSPKQMGIIGWTAVASFGAMIVLTPGALENTELMMRHLLQTAFLGILVLYIYKLVSETLRQRYEQVESEKRIASLVETDRIKSEFITVISHQLRTPLTAARYAMLGMADTGDEDERTRYREQAIMRVDESLRIVEEMLRSMEIATGQTSSSGTALDLGELVRTVADSLDQEAIRNGVSILVHAEGKFPVQVNHALLSFALTNVLENAITYSPRTVVEATVRRSDRSVEVLVRDHGIGIAPDDVPHIFERFYRGSNAMHLAPNESGIGLYTAREIVRRHGGDIELAKTALGEGTTMVITLPLHEASKAAD